MAEGGRMTMFGDMDVGELDWDGVQSGLLYHCGRMLL